MAIKFYVDCVATAPEPVECLNDERDAKRRQICVNSHFDTIEEAWEWLRKDAEIEEANAARFVEHAHKGLEKAREDLIRAALRIVQIRESATRSKGAR